jgi:TRAP-type C4-dicarboxylate transport system permease small subunit
MTTQSRLDAMALRTERLSVYLAAVGGVCLLAIVIVVTLGIVMRYAFDAPLLGINEFVQLAAVPTVMASLPYCTVKNDHVAVDIFERCCHVNGTEVAGSLIWA